MCLGFIDALTCLGFCINQDPARLESIPSIVALRPVVDRPFLGNQPFCPNCKKGRVLAQDRVNRQQQDVIDYLQEENRVLRTGLQGKRLKLSDDDRRRLAVKAQALGREALAQIASSCHTRYASALVPLPHRSQVRWQQEPEPRPTCPFYLFIRAPRT